MPIHPTSHARHSAKDLGRHLGRRFLLAGFAVVLFVVSSAGIAYFDIKSQLTIIDTDSLIGTDRPSRAEPVKDNYEGQAVNILVLGSDTREGSNNVDGSEGSEDVVVARSDTALVMHLSADRSRIDVVSIPRDTLVDVPSCITADGSTTEAQSDTQFNQAFANGAGTSTDDAAVAAGVACTVRTVESMTDLFIDEWMVVDFSGLSTMVDSLGGVKVYVDEDIDDPDYTGLVLDAGCHTMNGTTALQYARVRHGVGDGSDLSRISRQQNLMSAMLRTAQSKNLLTGGDDLYSFARSSLSTLTVSPGIGDLAVLGGLAQSIQAIGMDKVNFITMPHGEAPWDPNRVVATEEADAVWAALREDKPVPEESISVAADGSAPNADTEATTSEDPEQEDTDTQTSKPAEPTTIQTTPDPASQCR